MSDVKSTPLPDEMFLLEVEDETSGRRYKTLNPGNTPTILMSVATNHFADFSAHYFKKHLGLGSTEWRMIFTLAQNPGVTATAVSDALGVDKGTVSRCVQRLCDKNMIEAGELHANGRSRGWYLTSTGMKMHERVLEASLTGQQKLFQNFSPSEVNVLCDLLRRFLNNIDNLGE